MKRMPEAFTDDAFLGGRLRVRQPRKGFRAGIDSVLLAAAVPARAGEAVFEAGCGPGVAALCLLARVREARLVAVEANPEYAALARANAERNHLSGRLRVIGGDALLAGKRAGPAGLSAGAFDHAFANPPYHSPGAAQASPDAGKAEAHLRAAPLAAWVKALARMVKPKGSVTLIQPAAALGELLSACERAALGDVRILPLWPRPGAPAGRMIVQARRGRKTPPTLLPGLVLHADDGRFREEAEAVLRHAAALSLTP